MSDNKQASNALLKGVEHIVKAELEKAPIDKTYTAVIKTVKPENLYDVFMQGQLYYDVPSIFKGLTVNSTVKVKIPQGQYSLMYIEGQFNIDIAGGEGSTEQGLVDKQIIAEVKSHISNKTNPHNVTKTQIGLGSVDNTADTNKNVNSARKFTTPRTIAGTSFDGSANIDINYNNLTNKPHIADYTIEEIATTSGYLKTYQLKKDSTYIGAKINIPKDMVVQSGAVKVVEQINVPYAGAVVGDKYIDLVISNSSSSHIYIPVKDLVGVYIAGNHITISDKNVVSAIVDASLSSTSTNPVQNKIINSALGTKINTSMINNSSTGNVLWTAEKILSQIEQSKSIGYQYTGTVTANKVVDMAIPAITDFKTPNVEVLVFIDGAWQKAIHGIDYAYAFTSSTNLRVTFFNAGQYKVNYFFMVTGSFSNIITSSVTPTTQNSGDYWFQKI